MRLGLKAGGMFWGLRGSLGSSPFMSNFSLWAPPPSQSYVLWRVGELRSQEVGGFSAHPML